jgi:hypothetical protein
MLAIVPTLMLGKQVLICVKLDRFEQVDRVLIFVINRRHVIFESSTALPAHQRGTPVLFFGI